MWFKSKKYETYKVFSLGDAPQVEVDWFHFNHRGVRVSLVPFTVGPNDIFSGWLIRNGAKNKETVLIYIND